MLFVNLMVHHLHVINFQLLKKKKKKKKKNMHGAICSHSFRIGKQLLVFHSVYNKNKNIIPINGDKQIAYIDYCHWRHLYIYNVYKKKYIYIIIYKYNVSCRVQSLKKKKKKKKKKK